MGLYQTQYGWRYHFQVNGRRYSGSGYPTKKVAREAEAEHRARLKNGKDEPQVSVLSSLLIEYLEYSKPRLVKKTWKYKRYVCQNFLNHVGEIPLDQVTPLIIESYLNTRKSNSNKNFHRKDLGTIFAWGQKHGFISHNPALQVAKYAESKLRRKVPTQEEMARIIMAAGKHRPFLMVIYHTMARLGEIMRLRWEDVNFEHRWVRLWTRKRKGGNFEYDQLPMSDALYQVLKDIWTNRESEEWVFINPKTGTRYNSRPRIMGNICKRAGVPHYGFHAIRHFVASYLADVEKASMKSLQTLLRHTQLRTTEIYLHSMDTGLRDVVNAVPAPESLCSSLCSFESKAVHLSPLETK